MNKNQEPKQSEPKSSPQIVEKQREHMGNRVSSYFLKGGHSATQTELKTKPFSKAPNTTIAEFATTAGPDE